MACIGALNGPMLPHDHLCNWYEYVTHTGQFHFLRTIVFSFRWNIQSVVGELMLGEYEQVFQVFWSECFLQRWGNIECYQKQGNKRGQSCVCYRIGKSI